jgi:uncharacterized protein
MHFRLIDVEDEPLSFEGPIDLPDVRDEAGAHLLAGPVRLRGRAERGPRGVDLAARLDARLRLECSRCLEPYESPLGVDFRLTLVPASAEEPAAEVDPTDQEAANLFLVEGERADLAEIASEQVYLNLPLKPVCDRACRGLCPSCGANRNRIECGCRQADVDPRLAPLERLKERFGGD